MATNDPADRPPKVSATKRLKYVMAPSAVRRAAAEQTTAWAPTQSGFDEGAGPLQKSLQRARRLAPELASATDAVNAALAAVEAALTALKLGVTASVPLDPLGGWQEELPSFLTFGKDGSTWRLLVASGFDDNWSQSALLSASKEVRLQAVDRLPALVDELVKVAEAQVIEVTAAAATANALAAAISEAR